MDGPQTNNKDQMERLHTHKHKRTIKLYTVLEMTSKMYAVNDQITQVYDNIKYRRRDRMINNINHIFSNKNANHTEINRHLSKKIEP